MKIYLPAAILFDCGIFDGGRGGAIRGEEMGIVVDFSCPSMEPEKPRLFPLNQS